MSVAFPITAVPIEAPRCPSIWELGAELQSESRWIAQLAERLHAGDDEDHALAVADLEQSLAAEEHQREALQRKADATCWVIGRLRGDASYHQEQAKRFAALAHSEANRADALEATLLQVLTRLQPEATSFRFLDHQLTSRTSDAVEIDDEDVLPVELVTISTSRRPDKTSIKQRIKAVIAAASAGLSKQQAAEVALDLAAKAIPGARLVKRRHWSIR